MIEQKAKVSGDPENDKVGENGGSWLKHWPWAILVIVLVFVVFVGLCGLVLGREMSRGPKQPVSCETNQDVVASLTPYPDESWTYYEEQVIITGPEKEVQQVAGWLGREGLQLQPIKECRLNYVAGAPSGGGDGLHYVFSEEERSTLTTNLYHVPGRGSVDRVIAAINRRDAEISVFAERNYLTSNSFSVCGNPGHIPVGSPYGSPVPLPVGDREAAKLFWEQWAFQQIGVGPTFKASVDGAALLHQGDGTVVGIFDTSPFLDPWDNLDDSGRLVPFRKTEFVKWLAPTMELERLALDVSYPRWELVRPELSEPEPDIRDHGLYVAGLVHAVTPKSEIHLVRVLDEYGCGDLYTLETALHTFIAELEAANGASNGDKPLDGVVINLSLGVGNPYGANSTALSSCTGLSATDELGLLCNVLQGARGKGAVIVAAAGNDSGPEQIPAAYGFVIGVQANDRNRNKSAFSNTGTTVSAPGGKGVPKADDEDSLECSCFPDYLDPSAEEADAIETYAIEAACDSSTVECSCNCYESIIGPLLFPPEAGSYWPTHYGFWNGTSFSAPLVSGQAALLLQKGVSPDDIYTNVKSAMGAEGSGVPIINIPKSLQ